MPRRVFLAVSINALHKQRLQSQRLEVVVITALVVRLLAVTKQLAQRP